MKTKISTFLKERQSRIKPTEANKLNLKRLNKIDFSGKMHIVDKLTNTDMILIKSGDLVISGINVEKGAVAVYQGKEDVLATIHYSSYEFDETKIDIEYFKTFLRSKTFRETINTQIRGGIKTVLKAKNFLPLEINLPELEDQIDIRNKINSSSWIILELSNINNSNESYISKLRQAILQEAVQGKLVPQNPNDEPASELLKKIQKEKDKLIKEGKMKKQKPLPPISDDEIPYELPKSWEWVRLGDLSASENYSFVDGPFGSNLKREHYVEKGIRIIQLQNVGEGFWKEGKNVYTSENKANELIRCNAYPGDLVIAKMAPVARATIIPGLHKKYVLCSDCVKFKPHKSININYIKYLLNSEIIRKRVILDSTGMTRQRTSLGKLKLLTIPLPPLSEQLRIVEKIDKLMVYCDELEKQVKENQGNSEKLMISVLKESFSN